MIRNMYCIRDSKVGVYYPPFTMDNDLYARRFFNDLCQSADSNVSKYPADYDLYRVGTFNMVIGLIESRDIEHICSALNPFKEEKSDA